MEDQPLEQARLVARIAEICAEWPHYGYRRVTAQLRHEGLIVNHKKGMRLMSAHRDDEPYIDPEYIERNAGQTA